MNGYGHISEGVRSSYKSSGPPSEYGNGLAQTTTSYTGGGRTLGRLSQSNAYDDDGGSSSSRRSKRSHRDDTGRRGKRFTDDDFSRTLDEYDMATRKDDRHRSGHDRKHSRGGNGSTRHHKSEEDVRSKESKHTTADAPSSQTTTSSQPRKTFDRDRFLKSVMEGKYASSGNGASARTAQNNDDDDDDGDDDDNDNDKEQLEFGHGNKSQGPMIGKVGSDGYTEVEIRRLDWSEFKTPKSAIFIGPAQSGKTSILMNMYAATADRFDFVFIFCGAASTAKQLSQLTFPAFVIEDFEPDTIRQIMNACKAVLKAYDIMPSVAFLIDDYLTEQWQARNSVWPTMFKKGHQFGISSFYAVHDTNDIHNSARPNAGMVSIGYNASEPLKEKAYKQFFKMAFETYSDFDKVYKKTVFDRGQSLVLLNTAEYGFQLRYLRSSKVELLDPYTLCSRDCYVLMHMFGKDPAEWQANSDGGPTVDNAAVKLMKMAFSGRPDEDTKAAQAAEEAQRDKTHVSHTVQAAIAKAQKMKKSLSPEEIAAMGGKRFIIAD